MAMGLDPRQRSSGEDPCQNIARLKGETSGGGRSPFKRRACRIWPKRQKLVR